MRLNRYILILFFSGCFLLPDCIIGQTPSSHKSTDAHYPIVIPEREDTAEVNSLNKLAGQVINTGDYSKGDSLAKKALQLAEKLFFKKGQADAYNYIGIIDYDKSDYPNSLKSHLTALKIREGIADKNGIASSYNSIGLIYWQQADYPSALKNCFTALTLYKELENKQGIGKVCGNIGIVYFSMRNYKESLKNMQEGLEIDQAIGDEHTVGNIYGNISVIYVRLGDYTEALKNLLLSLKINKETGNKLGMSTNYSNIGSLYMGQKKYQQARRYLDSALALTKAMGTKDVMRDAYNNIAALDSTIGNYRAAYADYKEFIIYRDSLSNEETTKKILSEQMNYEFDKKMTAEKAEQERINIIRIAENKRKSIITYSTMIILIITILSASLLINAQRLKRKKEKALLEEELINSKKALEEYTKDMAGKNALLEEFNNEIENLRNLNAKDQVEERIKQVEILNKSTILTKDDWDKFKRLFDQVHKGFFARLKEKLPDLTQSEIRLICLTKLELDTKQMASILGLSYNSIKQRRYELRKKLGLSQEDSIDDIAESI